MKLNTEEKLKRIRRIILDSSELFMSKEKFLIFRNIVLNEFGSCLREICQNNVLGGKL